MMRNFKWYRKMKGGKWWYVRSYRFEEEYFWFHETECDEFPEHDGLFMDNVSTAYWGSWLSYDRGHSYIGWEYMENTPTENWVGFDNVMER